MTAEAQAPLPATFTSAEAAQLGLSRRRLLALQEEGTIERISRGIYRRTDAEIADFDLLEIAIKPPRQRSALLRHLLSTI